MPILIAQHNSKDIEHVCVGVVGGFTKLPKSECLILFLCAVAVSMVGVFQHGST